MSPGQGHVSQICPPYDPSLSSQRDTGRPHIRVLHVGRHKMHSQPPRKQDDTGQPGAQRALVLRAESRPGPHGPLTAAPGATGHAPRAPSCTCCLPKRSLRPLAFPTLSPFTAFSFLSPPADTHHSPRRARRAARSSSGLLIRSGACLQLSQRSRGEGEPSQPCSLHLNPLPGTPFP